MTQNKPDSEATEDLATTDTATNGLSGKILERKTLADIEIARRKQKLEELRATHQIALENRLEDFRESEILRRHKIMDDSNNQNWLKSYWRPAMAWVYALICLFDFVLAPIMMSLMPVFIKGATYHAWTSLTLENGGLIHLAFAAILGVTSWTRGLQSTQINALLEDSAIRGKPKSSTKN